MSGKLLIFGGTSEGRVLCEALSRQGREGVVCTATPYGGGMVDGLPGITVRSERLNSEKMEAFIQAGTFDRVVDATHPYAQEVTLNIRAACERAGVQYIRVLREKLADAAGIRLLPDIRAAVDYLNGTSGRVLLTTGSKELEPFCALHEYHNRLFARVLPDAEVIRHCNRLGFSGAQIIAMQGPFSHDLNLAMLRQLDCRYLVTKNTGSAGGLENKVSAALEAEVEIVMIARPLEENGQTLAEALELLGVNDNT